MKAVVYSCAAGLAIAAPSPDVLAKFHQFRAKWGHSYVGTEYHRRAEYFEQNLQQIERLEKAETGTAIYSYLGPFADLSEDEMSQRFGWLATGAAEETGSASLLNVTLASSFDWVAKGAVNPIQDQGQCGSCWSFSTVCNFEGAGFVSGGKLVKLSEQEIVDCDKTCHGCHGGLPSLALTWTSTHGGVGSEADYPYHARDGTCRTVGALALNTGYKPISKDEDQIAQALTTYGPLSIGVDATPFQHYSGGVMQNPRCSKTRLDHAVNIVGYGVDQVQYWKIRNSWSTKWGEEGYIRVLRGDCTCGLCTTVVTATGVTVHDAPTPTPPVPPPTCQDTIGFCPSTPNWECQFLAQECKKSCGCCEKNPPDFCLNANNVDPQSIFDEIKQLVCQQLAKGTVTEAEAEQLICSHFKDQVAMCDEVVQILWSELEKTCAPSSASTVDPRSIFDEIKKFVCQYLAKGAVTEAQAEKLICSQFPQQAATCAKAVKFLWNELEQTCAASVVV